MIRSVSQQAFKSVIPDSFCIFGKRQILSAPILTSFFCLFFWELRPYVTTDRNTKVEQSYSDLINMIFSRVVGNIFFKNPVYI